MTLHIASGPTYFQVGDLDHHFSNFVGDRCGQKAHHAREPERYQRIIYQDYPDYTNGGRAAFHPKFVDLAPSASRRIRRAEKEAVVEGDSVQACMHKVDRPAEFTLGAERRTNKNSGMKSRSHKYRSSLYLVVPEDHNESLAVMKLYILGEDGVNIKAITEAVRGSFLYIQLIEPRLIELQVSAPYLAGFAAARKFAIMLLRDLYPEFLSSAAPPTRIIQNRIHHANRNADTTTAPRGHHHPSCSWGVGGECHYLRGATGNEGFLERHYVDEDGRTIYYRRYGEEADTPQPRRNTRRAQYAPNAAGNRNDDVGEAYDDVFIDPPCAACATRAGRPNRNVAGAFGGPEENRRGEGRFVNLEGRREHRFATNSSSFGGMPPYLGLNPRVHQRSRGRTSVDPSFPQQQQQQEQARSEFTSGYEEMRGTTRRLQPHVPQMNNGTQMNNGAQHQRFLSGQPRLTENRRVHHRSNQAVSMQREGLNSATNQQQQQQRRQQVTLSQLVSPPNNRIRGIHSV